MTKRSMSYLAATAALAPIVAGLATPAATASPIDDINAAVARATSGDNPLDVLNDIADKLNSSEGKDALGDITSGLNELADRLNTLDGELNTDSVNNTGANEDINKSLNEIKDILAKLKGNADNTESGDSGDTPKPTDNLKPDTSDKTDSLDKIADELSRLRKELEHSNGTVNSDDIDRMLKKATEAVKAQDKELDELIQRGDELDYNDREAVKAYRDDVQNFLDRVSGDDNHQPESKPSESKPSETKTSEKKSSEKPSEKSSTSEPTDSADKKSEHNDAITADDFLGSLTKDWDKEPKDSDSDKDKDSGDKDSDKDSASGKKSEGTDSDKDSDKDSSDSEDNTNDTSNSGIQPVSDTAGNTVGYTAGTGSSGGNAAQPAGSTTTYDDHNSRTQAHPQGQSQQAQQPQTQQPAAEPVQQGPAVHTGGQVKNNTLVNFFADLFLRSK